MAEGGNHIPTSNHSAGVNPTFLTGRKKGVSEWTDDFIVSRLDRMTTHTENSLGRDDLSVMTLSPSSLQSVLTSLERKKPEGNAVSRRD